MMGRLLVCVALAAAPVAAQETPRSVAVGIRGGAEVHRGGRGPGHVGLQAWVPLGDRLHVVTAVDLLPEFPDDPLGQWGGWAGRTYLTLQARPFSQGWLPGVGYGLTAYYARADNSARSLSPSSLDLTDAAVIALRGPAWRVHPYAEVYLVNVLRRAGKAGGHFFVGLRGSVN